MFDEWSTCIIVGILLITIVMCIFSCKRLWDQQQEIRSDMRYCVTEEQMKSFVNSKCGGDGGLSSHGRRASAAADTDTDDGFTRDIAR
jgi:hypothetical protein